MNSTTITAPGPPRRSVLLRRWRNSAGASNEVIARAIAIAWAHAPMSTFQLPMVKESIGWSAATAVSAADLAVAGFMSAPAGASTALADTFPPTPFHRPGAMDDPFVASLGSVWETASTYFKPYAACRYIHTALKSLAVLRLAHGLTADNVDRIEVFTPQASMNLTDPAPVSIDHAQYSFPFVLAAMLIHGAAGAGEINETRLHDADLLAVAARVDVVHDPSLDPTYPAHYATRLVVTAHHGRFELTRLVGPGDPDDPMTEADLAAKFVLLATGRFGRVRALDLARTLVDDELPDLHDALAPVING